MGLTAEKWRSTRRSVRSPDMAGRPKKPKGEKFVSIGLRMPPGVLAQVDAEIPRLTVETGVELNRSQAVVALVRLGLQARAKTRGDK
jgi:hypothetical protein